MSDASDVSSSACIDCTCVSAEKDSDTAASIVAVLSGAAPALGAVCSVMSSGAADINAE